MAQAHRDIGDTHMMLWSEEVTPGVTKITLSGRMDIAGVQEIDLPFNVLIGAQRALIIDLSEVAFIASMGLRTLLKGASAVAAKGGKIALWRPIPEVANVLEISGISALVPIVEELEAAIRAVSVE
ncbi:MAG TPA: STAS domain-containing protein [Acetobacteraceae bacterium]